MTKDIQKVAGQIRNCDSRLHQANHRLDVLNQRPGFELCLDNVRASGEHTQAPLSLSLRLRPDRRRPSPAARSKPPCGAGSSSAPPTDSDRTRPDRPKTTPGPEAPMEGERRRAEEGARPRANGGVLQLMAVAHS
ncbi:unnamed protein product [Menidia menidia]|uniref:(Atlantic silverside) hypothetical protein n=1 Tax=Menidia menidia TaxID=238744 RepID=A0A8S4ALM7_9TELE|nr:unnamed protein product [Menidia menidia]